MKRLLLLLIITFLFVSCEENYRYEVRKERFSTKADTIYKDNSTEISAINRTFYHWETMYSDMTITQNTFDKKYTIKIVDYDKPKTKDNYYEGLSLGMITFKNDKKFEWFINTIDTILANPDKKLKYYIMNKQDRVGAISNSLAFNGNAHVWFRSFIDSGVSMTFPQRELDSLRACYVRYKEESN